MLKPLLGPTMLLITHRTLPIKKLIKKGLKWGLGWGLAPGFP